MYRYFVAANIALEDNSSFYANFYYEIDYKLNDIENVEKIIKDIGKQYNSEKVVILFFTELKDEYDNE